MPYLDGRPMAPHITVFIVARGINIGLHTRLYFGDEAEANAPARCWPASTSARGVGPCRVAQRGGGLPVYTFDIRLQGTGETVFFDV